MHHYGLCTMEMMHYEDADCQSTYGIDKPISVRQENGTQIPEETQLAALDVVGVDALLCKWLRTVILYMSNGAMFCPMSIWESYDTLTSWDNFRQSESV